MSLALVKDDSHSGEWQASARNSQHSMSAVVYKQT